MLRWFKWPKTATDQQHKWAVTEEWKQCRTANSSEESLKTFVVRYGAGTGVVRSGISGTRIRRAWDRQPITELCGGTPNRVQEQNPGREVRGTTVWNWRRFFYYTVNNCYGWRFGFWIIWTKTWRNSANRLQLTFKYWTAIFLIPRLMGGLTPDPDKLRPWQETD